MEQPPAALGAELTDGLRTALGPDLVAVYLYGSATSGGFDSSVSDIDLLVVTGGDLDADCAARVEELHARTIERHPEWVDRLELVYVGLQTLGRFREGGSLGVISPGEAFHIREGVELWLGNFYLVRETGVTLAGPAPTLIIPCISWDEFTAAIRRYAEEVSGRDLRVATPGERAYAVLTMCRALCTLRSNRPCSKQDGAAWAMAQLQEWAWLIDEAVRCRLSRGRSGFADDETLRAAEVLIGVLRDAIVG